MLRWPLKSGGPGPNAEASAVTMGLLLRGKGGSAADVVTTEHDTSLAKNDVYIELFRT